MEVNGSAAMLATKRSVGVQPEMNIGLRNTYVSAKCK